MRETLTRPPADPLEAVTHPEPYPYYARLTADRPFGFDAALGMWVAASAQAVEAVLEHQSLGVRPPDEPVPAHLTGTATGDVFGRLIRMNDGSYHRETRPIVEAELAAIDGEAVAKIAAGIARELLAGLETKELPERIDRLMSALPVGVTARLVGLGADERETVTHAVAAFVDAIMPGVPAASDASTVELLERLAAARDREPGALAGKLAARLAEDAALANALGLLMQSYEATAGLIGNALVAARREAVGGRAVSVDARFAREVARHDAPVQNTRRFALEDCRVYGRELRRGDAVLVILAAANRDPAANPEPERFLSERDNPRLYTFGRAGHRCPGEEIAVTIAVEAAAALRSTGVDWAMLPEPAGYVTSTNGRIPRFATRAARHSEEGA